MTWEWRLASLSRLPLPELERLRDQCESERGRIIQGGTRKAIIASLEAERAAFWDEKARLVQNAPRGGRYSDPDMLTAEECNEFLRSLPPVPLWGEVAE